MSPMNQEQGPRESIIFRTRGVGELKVTGPPGMDIEGISGPNKTFRLPVEISGAGTPETVININENGRA